jgi:hypothetical protein
MVHLKLGKGPPIGPYDTLIAAHARAEKATLVTHNTREFGRVEGLVAEDWEAAPASKGSMRGYGKMNTERMSSELPMLQAAYNLVALLPVVAALVVVVALLAGCTINPVTAPNGDAPQPVDYALPEHWLALPVTITQPVDLFYLFPTSYRKATPDAPNIAAIDDPGMIKGAQTVYGRQATAFEGVANIFAPYYRQADAAYTLALPKVEQDQVVGGIPATDAMAAFAYYLEHYNDGRPFILAGHSQGSNVLLFLLSDYMKAHPEVYERMVAAYVIGYSVTPAFLAQNPHLRFAEGPDDTGVIVSYNTEAPTIGGTNPVVLPGALAINPITWTRDETLAAAEQNLGSIALNPDGTAVLGVDGTPALVPNFADAQVDRARGVVMCSTCPVDKLAPGNAVFPKGVFHTFDYPFYYFDIRANAADRIGRYLASGQ